jgi:hypothetical protein
MLCSSRIRILLELRVSITDTSFQRASTRVSDLPSYSPYSYLGSLRAYEFFGTTLEAHAKMNTGFRLTVRKDVSRAHERAVSHAPELMIGFIDILRSICITSNPHDPLQVRIPIKERTVDEESGWTIPSEKAAVI